MSRVMKGTFLVMKDFDRVKYPTYQSSLLIKYSMLEAVPSRTLR